MKVKLIKPFCGRKPGAIVTMHPLNARMYYKQGVCVGSTDEEQEFLEKSIIGRGKVVETQIRAKATEHATVVPELSKKPRTPRKPRDKTTGRRKS